jgi:hypothetical protein
MLIRTRGRCRRKKMRRGPEDQTSQAAITFSMFT